MRYLSTNVGEIDLSLILNSKEFQSQLKNINSQANTASSKISSSLSKIGKAVATAFSVVSIVKFGKECLNVVSETSNAWIGLNSILTGQGKSFDKAKQFINEYVSDGLVPLKNAVSAYKNLALRGYNSDQIQKTMNALKNSATFARQSTYSLGDAVQTATEGLKNENSVVVDNAGVTKNVAKMWEDYAKSIGKTTNNLTQAEKIQAEVNGILEETKFQSNDATIYANTYSGKIAQLNSAFTNMKVAIGNAIQPIAKLFVPIITSAVNVVTRLFTALSGLLSLFGLKADSVETVSSGIGDIATQADKSSEAVEGVGDSAKKAGKEAKKASNNLAAFDNINVLSKDTDSSSGSGSGGSGNSGSLGELTDTLDVTSTVTEDTSVFNGLIERVKELASLFKQGFDISFGDTNFDGILKHLNGIKEKIIDIWTDPEVVNSAKNWTATLFYTLGQTTGAIARIGVNIVENLVGSIDKYLSQNVERIKSHICKMFDISNKDFTLIGNLFQALGEISEALKGDIAKKIGSNIIAIFMNPIMSVQELLGKFVKDILGLLMQPIIDNTEKIKITIENVMQPVQAITETLANMFTYIGDKCNEVYDIYISPFMESLKTGLSDTFSKFLDVYNEFVVPFFNNMAERFTNLWEQHLKPLVDKLGEFIGSVAQALQALWEGLLKPLIDWIIQNIVPVLVPIFETIWNTISTVFGAIADVISGILQTFKGLIDFIVGIFTGDWNKAWEGIKTFFEGIWETIKSIVTVVWEAIFGIITTIIEIIKGKIVTVFTAISTVISNIFNGIKNVISTIWNGITTTIANVINNIKSKITTVFSTIRDTISNIFNSVKNTVANIWNGIWSTIKGVINKILGGIESFANGIVRGINKVLSALDGVVTAVGDVIGMDISVPKLNEISIPRLAKGGYVKANTPQLAMIGDNKHQGEVVAPEDKMLDMILTALKMFKEESNFQNNNSQSNIVTINFAGTLAQLIRVLKPELDKESKRRGDRLVLGGAI